MSSLRERRPRAAAHVASDHRLAKHLQQNPSDDENSLMSKNVADNSDDAIAFVNAAEDAADSNDKNEGDDDPPFRKFGHLHIGKRVRYYFYPPSSSSTFTTLSSTTTKKVYIDGTITGYLSPHDVDSTNAPAFICTRTHRPASLFHVEFDDDNEYYRFKDLEEFDLTECCTWLSKNVGDKKRSSIASSDDDESEDDEEEGGPITICDTKLLTSQNKPTATKQTVSDRGLKPAADTMAADDEEEGEFAFNGQLYSSYNEMVNAKRQRNEDRFTKLGLLEAKAAVDTASSDTKCPVSNRGLKRAADTTQRYQQQPTERRKSSRLADDTATKKYIDSEDDCIESDDDVPENDCIESDDVLTKAEDAQIIAFRDEWEMNHGSKFRMGLTGRMKALTGRMKAEVVKIWEGMKGSELWDKDIELMDDIDQVSDDEYKRLTKMMDTLETNSVVDTEDAPCHVDGLLTDSALNDYNFGVLDTSFNAFRGMQAKKLVEENKMTPEMRQRYVEPEKKRHANVDLKTRGGCNPQVANLTLGKMGAEKICLMMQVANGIEGQRDMWKHFPQKNGQGIKIIFRGGSRMIEGVCEKITIEGVREFEKFLLSDKNYEPDNLTEQGKEALAVMKKRRKGADETAKSRRKTAKKAESVTINEYTEEAVSDEDVMVVDE